MPNFLSELAYYYNNNFVQFVLNLTDKEINNIVSYILSSKDDVELDSICKIIDKIRLGIGNGEVEDILSSERVNQLNCFLK